MEQCKKLINRRDIPCRCNNWRVDYSFKRLSI